MKLKRLVQIMFISGGIASLASCAAMHKDGADTSDANSMTSSAQTSGLGNSGGFGQDSEQGLAKRTYYFQFDQSTVREEDKSSILANAENLVSHPRMKVLLEGHTDPRGSREYNVALGERRANAVADILRSRGVNADQIRVVSYGAERLAVPGHTEEDYQQDRRVVLVYLQQ